MGSEAIPACRDPIASITGLVLDALTSPQRRAVYRHALANVLSW
jgi:hypothetical protein